MIVMARVERKFTGDVYLHLIKPTDMVEMHEGDEFITVELRVNPWDEIFE